jgi:hypothetical protein
VSSVGNVDDGDVIDGNVDDAVWMMVNIMLMAVYGGR